MQTKQEVIAYCHSFEQVYEDYPFHDSNWCVMRHKGSKKTFALIYNKDGHVWINVKCDPQWRDFWRSTFTSPEVPVFNPLVQKEESVPFPDQAFYTIRAFATK